MTKKIIILLILTLSSLIVSAQNFVGKWWLGILEEAMLPLNITFEKNDSTITPILYSPLQTKEAIYPTKYKFKNDTLNIEQKNFNLKLNLIYSAKDSTWNGKFKQNFYVYNITFKPCNTLLKINRYQNPQKPFPYLEKEIKVIRKKEGITLTGTLTMPKDGDNFPAVVLVSGSGQQNRDEELMGHRPFAVLSDWLTRQGIAVLRYDDRGVGGSTLGPLNATTLDFAEDAMAMTKWLKKQKHIDKNCIGIIGHSEGGLIAQIAATKMNNLAFIIMLAGPGCSGLDVLLQQNEAIFKLAGIDNKLIQTRLNYLSAIITNQPDAEKILEPLTKEERKQIELNKGAIILLKKQLESDWFKKFLELNPADYLPKINCPILAINGDKDCQVIASKNLAAIKQLAPHAETREIKDLNHLMQHCKTGVPYEYCIINETFAEEVMQLISDWIKQQQKEASTIKK